jgi:MoxR-like ATPase
MTPPKSKADGPAGAPVGATDPTGVPLPPPSGKRTPVADDATAATTADQTGVPLPPPSGKRTPVADDATAATTADQTGVPLPPPGGKRTPVGGTGGREPAGRAFAAGPADVVRPHAEVQYAAELAALAEADDRPRPPSWRLSPWAVATYLLGGRLPDGTEITPKYIGQRRLVEVAVATLATDRALLLLGVPGTAKTWVSEHLAAAISGDSTLLVQGTSGTPEEAIRYGWNYARLLAEGPSRAAVVASPVMRAMERGSLARVEELTRIPSDVQDALITILSEKTLPIPELDDEVQARQGFNVIATANDRDRGVNELSSALRRRFNTVVLPLPADADEEVGIVARRVADLGAALGLPAELDALAEIRRVVTVFRELRSGVTADGRTRLKSPTATLSTAEAISVVTNGAALATHFGDGVLRAADVAGGLTGAVVKDPAQDGLVWAEYLETVVRERDGWDDLYRACRELA